MTKLGKLSALTLAAFALALAAAGAHASGQQRLYQECLAKVKDAKDPVEARNQCVWDHWDRMSEYN